MATPQIQLAAALPQLTGDIQIGGYLITSLGGTAKKYTNRTGHTSIKGELVQLDDSNDESVVLASVDSYDHMGVIYEAGVANGSECWVVTHGEAQILLEDGTTATRGYWVKPSSSDAGRVDITDAAPSGGTIAQLDEHFREVGHCEETKASGTDVLCKVHLHFN